MMGFLFCFLIVVFFAKENPLQNTEGGLLLLEIYLLLTGHGSLSYVIVSLSVSRRVPQPSFPATSTTGIKIVEP